MDQGDARAQYGYGMCLVKSYDFDAAVKWLGRVAGQGDGDAQSAPEACYYNGYGMAQDYQAAVQ